MRRSGWTPSIAPRGFEETVYLVLDDFGRGGRYWRETDTERTGLETVIDDLLAGQYNNPSAVVAFNVAERSGFRPAKQKSSRCYLPSRMPARRTDLL